jgi:hypothetical protein
MNSIHNTNQQITANFSSVGLHMYLNTFKVWSIKLYLLSQNKYAINSHTFHSTSSNSAVQNTMCSNHFSAAFWWGLCYLCQCEYISILVNVLWIIIQKVSLGAKSLHSKKLIFWNALSHECGHTEYSGPQQSK